MQAQRQPGEASQVRIDHQDALTLLAHDRAEDVLKAGEALGVLEEKALLHTAVVLGGMNLPMAITSAVMKDLLEGPDLVAAVLPEAQAALQEFSVLSADDDAEDDDI